MSAEDDYLKLQEVLSEAKTDLSNLRTSYESSLSAMKEEVAYMREQIMAQRNMLENTVSYACRLEKQLQDLANNLKKE